MARIDDSAFQREAAAIYDAHWKFRPASARGLGFHEHDGVVPDHSAAAIAAEIARLRAARERLAAYLPVGLGPTARIEREVLLAELDDALFSLATWRAPFTNPMFYLRNRSLDVSSYLDRDYAPLAERARAIIRTADAAPAYLETARQNLEPAVPRPWLETALLICRGQIAYLGKEAKALLAPLGDDPLRREAEAALDRLAAEAAGYAKFLESRLPQATSDYALGAETFLATLRASEAVDVDLATLERVGRAELERDYQALVAAAKQIDPRRPVAEVIAEWRKDRSSPDEVVALAAQQTEELHRFVVAKDLVTIPGDDPVEVRPTPAFMAFNPAFLFGPGPFEKKPLPSFYYVTVPDKAWPAEKRSEYIFPRPMLLFVSAHEVWPGHFLQGLHTNRNKSRILQSFCSYAYSEGWALYVEEMMWDAGLGNGDPRAHIGQLLSALMRSARYLAAIGLHTGGMTVDQATALFRDKAFLDETNARQQAMRGTFDPFYLNYTLGKLMIMKLRADWKAKQGDRYSLKRFHDELLGLGCAPLPVLRRAMLGDDAGPAL